MYTCQTIAICGGDRRSAIVLQGIVGLQNLGNICFANSILQCLLCLPHVNACFSAGGAAAEAAASLQGDRDFIAAAFTELVQEAWLSAKASILTPERCI